MKIQIGIMGSAEDLKYTKECEKIAEKVGELLALKGAVTVYGAEQDYDSLSTAGARGAKRKSGTTVGITYGKSKIVFDKKCTDILISCGLDRGGGREFVLVNSCDAIITIGGGSGTLTEMAIAYQSNIPVVCLDKTGGWSEKLKEKYLDQRKRLKFVSAKNPEDAVTKALEVVNKNEKI